MHFLFMLLLSVSSDPGALCAANEIPDAADPKTLDAAALDAVIADHPGCMPAHYLRAHTMLGEEGRDVEGAIGHLDRARELAPDNSRILSLLGQLHLMVAQENTSLTAARRGRKFLEEAVAANPEDLDARSILAGFHRNAPWIAGGDIDDAYEQATEIRKRDLKRGLLEQARTLRADGEEEKAIRLAESTLQQFPGYAALAVEYALLMQQEKKYAAAHEVLLAATQAEKAEPMSLYQLGRNAALSGEYLAQGRAALQAYLDLIEAGEDVPIGAAPAWWRLGMIEQHDGRIAAAREAFETSLALDPDYEDAAASLKALSP